MLRLALLATLVGAWGCSDNLTSTTAPRSFPHAQWDLQDVSILLPVPKDNRERDTLLGLSSVGAKGVVFPLSYFQAERPSTIIDPKVQDEELYPTFWKLVAMRYVPCDAAPLGRPCAAQIRLSFQLVSADFAADFAYHLFFGLSAEEARQARDLLADLRQDSPVSTEGLALGPHVGLAAEGLASEYHTRFRDGLLSLVGEDNLLRFTFAFIRHVEGHDALFGWDFGGFDVLEGELHDLAIPRSGDAIRQRLVVERPNDPGFPPQKPVDDTDLFFPVIEPLPAGGDDFSPLFSTAEELRALEDAAFADALAAAEAVQLPDAHNTETMDCVSCHIAHKSAHLARKARRIAEEIPGSQEGVYLGGHDDYEGDYRVIRAFAWADRRYGDRAVVIPRVVLESANVVSYLRANHPMTQAARTPL